MYVCIQAHRYVHNTSHSFLLTALTQFIRTIYVRVLHQTAKHASLQCIIICIDLYVMKVNLYMYVYVQQPKVLAHMF